MTITPGEVPGARTEEPLLAEEPLPPGDQDLAEGPVLGVPDGRGGHRPGGVRQRCPQDFVFGTQPGDLVAGGVREVALSGDLSQVFHDVHDVSPG